MDSEPPDAGLLRMSPPRSSWKSRDSVGQQMSFMTEVQKEGVGKGVVDSVVPESRHDQPPNKLILTVRCLRELEAIVASIRAAIQSAAEPPVVVSTDRRTGDPAVSDCGPDTAV